VRSRGESEDILEKESGLFSPFLEIFRSEKCVGQKEWGSGVGDFGGKS